MEFNSRIFVDNDTIIFFDYRADRMREITESMGMERYKDLKSELPHPKNLVIFHSFSVSKKKIFGKGKEP